jgi:hypothetical protein
VSDCIVACAPPAGFRPQSTCLSGLDCDDSNGADWIHPGATELCGDGVDSNCAGGDNETFTNLGASCVRGDYGVCRRVGEYVCSSDRRTTECNAATATPGAEQTYASTDADIDLSTARSDYDPRWDWNCDNANTFDLGSQTLWTSTFRQRACQGNFESACNWLTVESQCNSGVLGTKFFSCAAVGVPGVCGQVVSYIGCLYGFYDTGQCDYLMNSYEANNSILACE